MLPVSLVILSHNRLKDLRRNIERLLSECGAPGELEMIIVDNNSTDGTQAYLQDLQRRRAELVVVLNDKNLGVAGGRNSGFARVQREFVVAQDDDTAIAMEDVKKAPHLFGQFPHAGILAFRVVHPETGELQNDHGSAPCEVANHHGAGFAFRSALYSELGGIDEECDFGAEELDFAIRVRADGWQIMYTPELTVYHNNSPAKGEAMKYRRIRRVYNNVRTYYKYFPRRMAFRNSSRYILLAARRWALDVGAGTVGQVFGAGLKGRKRGLVQHRPVPRETAAFYDNPLLRPEFGNVPLLSKFFARTPVGSNPGQLRPAPSKRCQP